MWRTMEDSNGRRRRKILICMIFFIFFHSPPMHEMFMFMLHNHICRYIRAPPARWLRVYVLRLAMQNDEKRKIVFLSLLASPA